MKSISKIIALLGMIAMLFTMVGCPNANAGGGEPPQTTAPTNNFKGKYFVGTLENGSEFGYALFSDKGVTLKTVDLIDCSYTFNEDVATITGTYGEKTVTLTTTKLEDKKKFSITYSKDLTGEEKDLVVTYTKATKPSTDPYSGKFFAGYIVETDGVATPEETAIMYFDFESKTVTPYMYIEDSFMQINDALAFTVDSKDLTDVKVTVNWVDEEESLEITSMGYDAKTESFKVDVPAALLLIDDAETVTIEFKKATKPEIPEVEEPELPYTVTFANPTDGHTATVSEEGVITITLAEKVAGDDPWGNQIFIEGVNGDTIVANAKICTSFTITSSINMPNFYVKNQFANDYTGIDKTVPLTAGEATEVKIYGIVSASYNADQEKFIIALRDNMTAGATLTISGLESKVITDEEYQAYLDSISAGTKNTDIFLKDGSANTITGPEFWWANAGGAWSAEDANLEGVSVKKVTTLLANDCGSFNFAAVPFKVGAKVTVEVYSETETSVAFKPIAPDVNSDVYPIPAGEWTTITLGLGDTPASLTKLGVIAKADNCVVYIGDIKVIDNE